MGFLDNIEKGSSSKSGTLNLIDFETSFVHTFNDRDVLDTKYKAEEFGITFDKRKRKSDVYLYNGEETITICPEPLEFIKEFDDVSDNTTKANELFLKKIATFKKLHLNKKPVLKSNTTYNDTIWMNKTLTGINLRPGNLNDDRENFTSVKMCDDNVHGLIVGRTGSGKSVFINALILSLITEYAPWELDLYLADFKKVELSRYMNNGDEKNENTPFTPHVNACAATSEIRYVISLIRYLVDCMNARQEFFARLGVTKIQEFRNKYNLVLPRVLLMVDEFQQLFTEATNRETEEIQTMLNSITKLGRATGFHLIFASQEMSGTLRGNTLANFKIRMALPCNQQISVDILGNAQAVNLDRGFVLVNTDSGDELKNKKYRVPFIETDKKDDDDDDIKTPFYDFLDQIKLASKLFELDYKTCMQKFYREELQETEHSYKNDLDKIRDKKNALVGKNHSLFDAVILGKSVLYSPKPNDKVSFYIEKGRNKGIMIACADADNAARIRKLLSENLFRSNLETYHFGMELNNLVLERYNIAENIKHYSNQTYYNCEIDKSVELLLVLYFMRQSASKLMSISQNDMRVIGEYENQLVYLLKDKKEIADYNQYKENKLLLEKEIKEIELNIEEVNKNSKKQIKNPMIPYLASCSNAIANIPAFGKEADLSSLYSYKEITSIFTTNLDIEIATKKSIELLDIAIENLEKNSTEEKQVKDLAILRNKLLKNAISFYYDKYNNVESKIKNAVLLDILSKVYVTIQSSVTSFKKELEEKGKFLEDSSKLLEEKTKKQKQLEQLKLNPNKIIALESKLSNLVHSFMTKVFDETYTVINAKKNKPIIQNIVYKEVNGVLQWNFYASNIDEKIQLIADDILNIYIATCRNQTSKTKLFKKVVFWINGLDEMEKTPNQFIEVIKNAINQNILIVAIITSELKDTLIRKAFDYAFVTGNIEKFYTMFDIKYTKQPLDSIVVNFGIRSKGFDIPFKMYKSNLEDVQAPNFIDSLLNE